MSGSLRAAAALSAAGMLLLPLFGLLLRFQPKFVHGLHVDAAKAERNCYVAAGCYGGVFLVSATLLCVRSRREARQARATRDADELRFAKMKNGGAAKKRDDAQRTDSRTSSREDTTIILDSPYEKDPAVL